MEVKWAHLAFISSWVSRLRWGDFQCPFIRPIRMERLKPLITRVCQNPHCQNMNISFPNPRHLQLHANRHSSSLHAPLAIHYFPLPLPAPQNWARPFASHPIYMLFPVLTVIHTSLVLFRGDNVSSPAMRYICLHKLSKVKPNQNPLSQILH